LFGSTSHNRPSRFIDEIPQDLIEVNGAIKPVQRQQPKYTEKEILDNKTLSAARGLSKEPEKVTKSEEYKIGDTVIHKTFGVGVVLSVQNVGNDTLIEIAFEKTGTKKLMANFAKLEKQ
ncbi:MAG: ATP-dependent DNA helicase PcrA, partial [Eubacteriales bacterium]